MHVAQEPRPGEAPPLLDARVENSIVAHSSVANKRRALDELEALLLCLCLPRLSRRGFAVVLFEPSLVDVAHKGGDDERGLFHGGATLAKFRYPARAANFKRFRTARSPAASERHVLVGSGVVTAEELESLGRRFRQGGLCRVRRRPFGNQALMCCCRCNSPPLMIAGQIHFRGKGCGGARSSGQSLRASVGCAQKVPWRSVVLPLLV